MAWETVARRLQEHGSLLAPVFFLLGVLIIVVLPTISSMRYSIDENAIGLYAPRVDTIDGIDTTIRWDRRLVRGTRSTGAEVIAVYVNTAYSVSVLIANTLIHELEKFNHMAADVMFFFVSASEPWPLPSAPTRAAVVVNVSLLEQMDMCVDTQGEDGTRPNQDLLNLAESLMRQAGLRPYYLCHVREDGGDDSLSALSHALLDMKQSLRTSLQPQPWHAFGTHSVNTIAFSTPTRRSSSSIARTRTFYFFFRLLATLNGLEERLHHSTFMWFGADDRSYLQYDVLQFSTILFVASIVAASYSVYQRYGVSISPLPVLLWVFAAGADGAVRSAGPVGFSVVTALGISALTLVRNQPAHSAFWMSINAVALCLMLLLHPAVGLLVGGATALQMLTLHERLRHSAAKCAGVLLGWVAVYVFCVREGMPLWSMQTFGNAFISLFVYPNALWVSAVSLSSLWRSARRRRTEEVTLCAGDAERKRQ